MLKNDLEQLQGDSVGVMGSSTKVKAYEIIQHGSDKCNNELQHGLWTLRADASWTHDNRVYHGIVAIEDRHHNEIQPAEATKMNDQCCSGLYWNVSQQPVI